MVVEQTLSKIVAITLIMLSQATIGQNTQESYRFFDVDSTEITQQEFLEKRATRKVLDIPLDSLHGFQLVKREHYGTVDPKLIYSALDEVSDGKLNRNQTYVIIYYPGKDACNSSGTSSMESRKKWTADLEKGIMKILGTKPIYIYKDLSGIEKYRPYIKWKKDPKQFFENTFFKYHYPCNSFVIISPTGNYISYFGENGKELIWKNAKKISRR